MKIYSSLLTFALALLLFAPQSFAQMFSVGEARGPSPSSNSYLRVGVSPLMFEFMGAQNIGPNTSQLEIDNTALHIAFESPGVELGVTLANGLTGLDEQALFDLNFTLSNRFILINKRSFLAGVPIQLHSSLTNVNNDRTEDNFSQTNFGIGGGAFFTLRFSEKILFSNEVTPGYGFSNSSGGFFGGSLFYVKAKSRLNFLRVLKNRSLSIGYDFNFKSFDIDDDFYDFDLTSHTITLAISL